MDNIENKYKNVERSMDIDAFRTSYDMIPNVYEYDIPDFEVNGDIVSCRDVEYDMKTNTGWFMEDSEKIPFRLEIKQYEPQSIVSFRVYIDENHIDTIDVGKYLVRDVDIIRSHVQDYEERITDRVLREKLGDKYYTMTEDELEEASWDLSPRDYPPDFDRTILGLHYDTDSYGYMIEYNSVRIMSMDTDKWEALQKLLKYLAVKILNINPDDTKRCKRNDKDILMQYAYAC